MSTFLYKNQDLESNEAILKKNICVTNKGFQYTLRNAFLKIYPCQGMKIPPCQSRLNFLCSCYDTSIVLKK